MNALTEIHRVLYRGRQDVEVRGAKGNLGWAEQGKDVRRVLEKWFEGDCSELLLPQSSLHSSKSYDWKGSADYYDSV